jgi:hypothetical protein
MEFLAEIGYFGQLEPWACSLYGLLMMVASVGLAFNMKKPTKKD